MNQSIGHRSRKSFSHCHGYRPPPRDAPQSLHDNPQYVSKVFQVTPGVYTSDVGCNSQNWSAKDGTKDCIFISTSTKIQYHVFQLLLGPMLGDHANIECQESKFGWFFYFIPLASFDCITPCISKLLKYIKCLIRPDATFNCVGVNFKTTSCVLDNFLHNRQTLAEEKFIQYFVDEDLGSPRCVRKLILEVGYGHFSDNILLQKLYFYAFQKVFAPPLDVVQECVLWRLICLLWKEEAVWKHFYNYLLQPLKDMMRNIKNQKQQFEEFVQICGHYSLSCMYSCFVYVCIWYY